MKIIHTSDWHLGHEFYDYDRTEEHVAFLEQLCDIVGAEQPDVLVISGDIYHTGTPSNSVMTLFTNYLVKIALAGNSNGGHMKVVVTAGNHDSSSRIEISRQLWQQIDVEVVGHIAKKDGVIDFDRLIIPITDATDKKIGYVVAMPHVFPQSFPPVSPDTPREERQKAFWEALNARLNQINTDKLPVVMMAHMAITGSDISGHDESRGGMDYVDIATIPVDFDYMALGHIHYAQNVQGTRARYCGSPVAVSFDESYEHSVSVVEVHAGQEPIIETREIVNPIPLITIPENAASREMVLKALEKLPDNEKVYVRIHVKFEDSQSGLIKEQAIEKIKNKQARFCTIKWERNDKPQDSGQVSNLQLEEIRDMSPLEIAKLHYEQLYNIPMSDDMIDMLNKIITEINNPNTPS